MNVQIVLYNCVIRLSFI